MKKGTKVKHRADPTGRAMIVTSETVVAAAWIEGGEACSDYFEPEELEVVEGAGLLAGGVDFAADGSGSVTVWTTTRLDGGAGPVKTRAESPWGQWVVAGEVVQRAAQHDELGPLCKRCSRAPDEGNACGASRGAQKTIGGDGVTRCAAFDLVASGAVFDEFDPRHHTIKVDTDGTGNSFPDDPKPSDADLADAIENKLCLACDHWLMRHRNHEGEPFCCGAGHVTGGPEDCCGVWARTEPPADGLATDEEIYPSGQRVPTRSEIETEDAAATLEAAGWFLISPGGHVTSPGTIRSGDPALATITEKCARLLVNRGWTVFGPEDDIPTPTPEPLDDLIAAAVKRRAGDEVSEDIADAMLDYQGGEYNCASCYKLLLDGRQCGDSQGPDDHCDDHEPDFQALAEGLLLLREDGTLRLRGGVDEAEAHPPDGLVAALREFATERLTKAELLRRFIGETVTLRCGDCSNMVHLACNDEPVSEQDPADGCPGFEPTWRHIAESLADWIEAQHGEAGEPDAQRPPEPARLIVPRGCCGPCSPAYTPRSMPISSLARSSVR
jgi:hypothetical protein